MNIENILTAATTPVTEFITTNNLRFQRGDITSYFHNISQLNFGLTLPLVPSEHLIPAIVLKNYFVLWNILVDDEIDRDGGSTLLQDSMRFLLTGQTQQPTGKLLQMILDQCSNQSQIVESTKFDFLNIMQGFDYERLINRYQMANTLEYRQFSTVTASINIMLDIDLSYCDIEQVDGLPHLRAAYHSFGRAIKFASDIGSLHRELTTEHNLNLVLLDFAHVKEIADPADVFATVQSDPEQLEYSINKVKKLAYQSLAHGQARLKRVAGDYSRLHATVKGVVDRYSQGADIFFQK